MITWILAAAAGAALSFSLLPVAEKFCIRQHKRLSRRARVAAICVGASALSVLPAFESFETAVVMTAVFCSLFVVGLVDLLELRIPNRIVWPSALLCAAAAAGAGLAGHQAGLAALVGSAAFTATIGLCHLLRPEAMGLGDVKLAIFLGLVIGFHAADPLRSLELIGWTTALASLIGIVMAALRRSTAALPFAPALAVATWGVSLSTQLVIR